ncbi:hypothetical protein GCM10017643_24280 [Ancylobacter dichloromethanicus]|uniref:Uncharacterized protein n=1 Tax=Ancylobacter dichloromethanicus TaxID=518825 RepID=A0A9W6MZT6_9HYPH|nr:hypothetical protein GCM10017643_24280 [Ancylobacter dichloromethanicus]
MTGFAALAGATGVRAVHTLRLSRRGGIPFKAAAIFAPVPFNASLPAVPALKVTTTALVISGLMLAPRPVSKPAAPAISPTEGTP